MSLFRPPELHPWQYCEPDPPWKKALDERLRNSEITGPHYRRWPYEIQQVGSHKWAILYGGKIIAHRPTLSRAKVYAQSDYIYRNNLHAGGGYRRVIHYPAP